MPRDILPVVKDSRYIKVYKTIQMNNLQKDIPMKQVLHTSRAAFHKRAKIIKIVEKSEDQECLTHVRKTFVYVLSTVVDETEKLGDPQIKIRKSFDTKTR